jgi:hypothetical protein
MNTKAQGIGPVTMMFSIVFTLVILAVVGGQLFGLWNLSDYSNIMNNVESFFMSQAVFWTFWGMVLGLITYFYFGGSK